MLLRGLAALLAAAVLQGPSTAAAQQAYPTEDLLRTTTTVMGEAIRYPAGTANVTVSIVTVAPGADTAWHHHPAPLVAYILEGDLTVDYRDRGRRVYRKGEALVEAMDVPHRGMNLGSVPVRLLAVYVGAEGIANTALDNTADK